LEALPPNLRKPFEKGLTLNFITAKLRFAKIFVGYTKKFGTVDVAVKWLTSRRYTPRCNGFSLRDNYEMEII